MVTAQAVNGTTNPYLEAAESVDFRWSHRGVLVERYAWAIPNDEALLTLARYGPLVEIGAGTGYWASLLRERGVDILAYDKRPLTRENHKNPYFYGSSQWTTVRKGTKAKAAKYHERTLFLCWPPYNSTMASDTLQTYQDAGGQTVVYVGEWEGCTGDALFHEMLMEGWEEIERVRLPRWPDIRDSLWVFRKKEAHA